ncbi:intercellular trafficking and secretion [Meristemomyces frigidus]
MEAQNSSTQDADLAEPVRRSIHPAAPAAHHDSGELDEGCNVWDNTTKHQYSTADTEAFPTHDDPASSTTGIKSPPSEDDEFVDVLSPTDEPDSDDYEVLGSGRDEFPQADGGPEQANGVHVYHTRKHSNKRRKIAKLLAAEQQRRAVSGASAMKEGNSNDYNDPSWQQAGGKADAVDLAGPGAHGRLDCIVDKPQKEGEGTPNVYVSYLVTTNTDFKSFQSSHSSVRRRFTDFVFLYKTLAKEYPQCAVPPLPDKHNMAYVRGDRFGPDFTARRAYSLSRFLKRLALHPVLRRATLLTLFLESSDWNATMKSRPARGMSGSEDRSSSVLETWTDGFLNAFSKPHKTDKRFQDVNERAKKLGDDLGTVSKTVARVAKREGDLETDYADLAAQYQKLAALEPGVHDELTKFATSVQSTSKGWKGLKEHTDQDYLGSLKDMDGYINSIKSLLKTREQKQLDFEGLTEYLNKEAQERDTLASHGNVGASGFLRQKIEDVRGVDHEQSRRERQRKLEVQISRLTTEVEAARKTTEAFDEEVVKEIGDFERIKAVEFRDTLGGLADANIAFFQSNIGIWERFVQDMEKQQAEAAEAAT